MKVAVYAIALNEARFVEQWLRCSEDADHRLICDTGSTDGTAELINGHSITVRPWRFDIARNAALAMLPADIDVCIALDMDEELKPGWREALERAWTPGTTRLRHPFAFRQDENGKPTSVMYGHRIHGRHDYFWHWPIHENLKHNGARPEHIAWCDDLWIHHHHSLKQTRATYLPMLYAAAAADPACDRMAFYYARELMYNGLKEKAILEFKRYLNLPATKWKDQRAEAMRFIGECGGGQAWFHRAVLEAPSRPAWIALAKALTQSSEWWGGYWAAEQAQLLPMPKGELYDVAEMESADEIKATCAHNLGLT